MTIQQWQIQPRIYFMLVKLTSASKKCALWVYLFQMNILTCHQVIPKSTVLFKTQHNTTHGPLGQSVTPVLTSFLTLAKIQVKRFKIFFPPQPYWNGGKRGKMSAGGLKIKSSFPDPVRPCIIVMSCRWEWSAGGKTFPLLVTTTLVSCSPCLQDLLHH